MKKRDTQHNGIDIAECFMLKVNMLSIVILTVVMLNVVLQSVLAAALG
jgi:hypothetical protein